MQQPKAWVFYSSISASIISNLNNIISKVCKLSLAKLTYDNKLAILISKLKASMFKKSSCVSFIFDENF